MAQTTSRVRRTSGRANSSARSAGLLVALDRREHELDRPFGGRSPRPPADWRGRGRRPRGRAARRGSGRAAGRRPGPRSARVPRGSSVELLGQMLAVQVGRADLDQAACRSSRARKRASGISSCESGKKKMRLPASCVAVARRARVRGALARRWRSRSSNARRVDAEGIGRGPQPARGALGAERERRGQMRLAPRSSSARAVSARNGWASRKRGVRARPAGSSAARRGGRKRTGADAELGEQPRELVLDHVGQRADDEQRAGRVGRRRGQARAPARRGRHPRPA